LQRKTAFSPFYREKKDNFQKHFISYLKRIVKEKVSVVEKIDPT